MGIYDRIKMLCEEKGVSVRKAETELGFGNGSLSKLNNSETTRKRIKLLAAYFGVSEDYIMCETDDRTPIPHQWQEYSDWEDDQRVFEGDDDTMWVPVVAKIAAGFPIACQEDILDSIAVPAEWQKKGRLIGLRIKGNSMEPLIPDNSDVIVLYGERVENGQIGVVQINGNESTCKKIHYQSNGILLESINRDYPPMFFSAEEVEQLPVRILGRVLEVRIRIN